MGPEFPIPGWRPAMVMETVRELVRATVAKETARELVRATVAKETVMGLVRAAMKMTALLYVLG